MTTGHAQEHRRHPTFRQYLVVATALFLITIVEFLIIWPDPRLTGILLVVVLGGLSAIKFGTVIMFYMHLKFDSRLFSWVFLGGLALAFAVVLALLGLFGALQIYTQPRGFAQENAKPYVPEHEEGGASPDGGMVGGDAEKLALGKKVFTDKGTCFACHTVQGVQGATGAVGPDLTHIGAMGAMHKPGMSADAYIRESIENPGAFVAPGFQAGLMPQGIRSTITDQEYEAVVAFLLAQK